MVFSTTARANPVATAASAALPPCSSIRRPALVASGCALVTRALPVATCGAVAMGVLISPAPESASVPQPLMPANRSAGRILRKCLNSKFTMSERSYYLAPIIVNEQARNAGRVRGRFLLRCAQRSAAPTMLSTSLQPSSIMDARASRMIFSTGYSRLNPLPPNI